MSLTHRNLVILRELASDVAVDDTCLTSTSLSNDNYFVLHLRLDFGLERRLVHDFKATEVHCVF